MAAGMEDGWAIPMATDMAFCIGCLTLLKGRVSQGLGGRAAPRCGP